MKKLVLMTSKKLFVNLLCNITQIKNDEIKLNFKKSMKQMVWSEMKEKDNNMTRIEQDDEVWVVLVEDKAVSEDLEDSDEDKDDLK